MSENSETSPILRSLLSIKSLLKLTLINISSF